ncbi:hypothetical protein [Martelella mangrovi]|uniref:Long-tail fiber proximal subunit trimerization domain-containing protein n=1 Tax=Martelella mangrovi TaxID=1397477 RepID=A0ABV2IGG3_9HYPH
MTQYENVTIDPTVTNGSQLAANINSWRKAALTLHSGVERPSYASAGTMWISTASSPWKLCVYDGTDDVVIGELKPDAHDFVSAGGTDYTNDLMTAGDAAEARNKLEAVAKSGDTVTGEIKASNDRNFRMMNGDRGVFWHLNSTDIYLMITNSGDQNGAWNDTRAIRVRLSDGFVWFNRARCNTNFEVGAARFETNGNAVGSVWNNWGAGDAYTAIGKRIEDRVNGRATAGARVQHDSGTYEIGTVTTSGNTVDCSGGMFVTGLRCQNWDWAVREIYVRAKYARNQ